ncbi:hypothetical protein ACQ859_00650 [Roseateles chitinivorans]|uniref:hypothetical protein n=1 Tax=Roseateles chitinivorans TaxID=2917965 RepID=UPI003D676BBA
MKFITTSPSQPLVKSASTTSGGSQVLALCELSDAEIDTVYGGDSWAGTPAGRATADGAACANTILTWSGIGATVGSMGGSFISVLGGWAIGGGLAAKFSQACNAAR